MVSLVTTYDMLLSVLGRLRSFPHTGICGPVCGGTAMAYHDLW